MERNKLEMKESLEGKMTQNHKYALAKTQLQLPLIIRDVLEGREILDDAGLYALSDMLSGYNPDQALLACALTMKEIAYSKGNYIQDLAFLNMESDRIIERYMSRADIAEENPELWSDTQDAMMHTVIEDLECFMEVTSLCHLSFEITDPKLAQIMHILTAQLQSQYMIVDQVLELLGDINHALEIETPQMTGYMAENVVMFPAA